MMIEPQKTLIYSANFKALDSLPKEQECYPKWTDLVRYLFQTMLVDCKTGLYRNKEDKHLVYSNRLPTYDSYQKLSLAKVMDVAKQNLAILQNDRVHAKYIFERLIEQERRLYKRGAKGIHGRLISFFSKLRNYLNGDGWITTANLAQNFVNKHFLSKQEKAKAKEEAVKMLTQVVGEDSSPIVRRVVEKLPIAPIEIEERKGFEINLEKRREINLKEEKCLSEKLPEGLSLDGLTFVQEENILLTMKEGGVTIKGLSLKAKPNELKLPTIAEEHLAPYRSILDSIPEVDIELKGIKESNDQYQLNIQLKQLPIPLKFDLPKHTFMQVLQSLKDPRIDDIVQSKLFSKSSV